MSNYNGREPASHVWQWNDERGQVRYIGWGTTSIDGVPPWERLWLDRERVRGTLGVWLRTLSAPPALDWRTVPTSPLTASAAAQLCQLLRRRGEGWLRSRDYCGSGTWRAVMGCRSLRALARQLGVSRRQASKYAGFSDYDGRSGRSEPKSAGSG